MDGIKVVFFDMGNTLLHFHYRKSDDEKDMQGLIYLTEYLNKFNSKIMLADVKKGFFDIWMAGIEDRKVKHTEYPIEDFLNHFLEKYGVKFDLEQCIEAINAFYTDYREQVLIEKGTEELLKAIRNKGYRIGVISNTCYYDQVMLECFKKANIYDLIDSYTFSYSLRVAKPHEDIFKAALKKMQITAAEAVMVGDNLKCDIKPALELGMKTIWLNEKNSNGSKDIVPDVEVHSIEDVITHM